MSLKRADLGQVATFVDVNPVVTILEPGSDATVVNTGTTQNMHLKFSIPKGDKGEKGEKGDQGPKGDQGEPFKIKKTFPTIENMNSRYTEIEPGEFVIISGEKIPGTDQINVNDADVGKLYVRNSDNDGNAEKFTFITDLSGAQGIQGPRGATGENGKDGKDGKDGLTYRYWFGVGDSGHLFAFYDDEAKNPSDVGMSWTDYVEATK